MSSRKKGINWRIGFACFCVVYVAWVVYLSLDNFDLVHTAYRDARARLEPARIEEIARRELTDRCRRQEKQSPGTRTTDAVAANERENSCLSWPPTVLAERQEIVKQRLLVEQGRFKRKLIVFYISFVLVFLALPLAFLYVLLTFFLWLLRNIKIIQ